MVQNGRPTQRRKATLRGAGLTALWVLIRHVKSVHQPPQAMCAAASAKSCLVAARQRLRFSHKPRSQERPAGSCPGTSTHPPLSSGSPAACWGDALLAHCAVDRCRDAHHDQAPSAGGPRSGPLPHGDAAHASAAPGAGRRRFGLAIAGAAVALAYGTEAGTGATESLHNHREGGSVASAGGSSVSGWASSCPPTCQGAAGRARRNTARCEHDLSLSRRCCSSPWGLGSACRLHCGRT